MTHEVNRDWMESMDIVQTPIALDEFPTDSMKNNFKDLDTHSTTSSLKRSARSNILHAIWATRQTENVSDKRIFAKTTLRELVIYLIFVILLLLITLLMVNSMTYFYYTSVYEIVVGNYQTGDEQPIDLYNQIHDHSDIWIYIRKQVFDALYWDTWYNKRNVSFGEKEFLGFDNKLLGVPRLRQVRVDPSGCKVPTEMSKIVAKCYPAYSDGVQATQPIQPKGNLTPMFTKEAWTYQSEAQSGSVGVVAMYGDYPGSGYIQHLSRSRAQSEAILKELFDGRWLDEASRVLFLDFTIYNANINMFIIVKLIFEMPYTGGVLVSNDFQPAKLVRYLTATEYFVMACEVIYVLFLLYYIVEEILEIKQHGYRYFLILWNLMDIAVIAVSVIHVTFTIYCTVTAYYAMNKLLDDFYSYPHFDKLSYWYGHSVRATALCVFLVVIKIFKYVNFDRSLGQLTKTLGAASIDLIGFVVMFCIIFFAFGQLGYLAFGANTEAYQSFTQCCYTLFRMMVGDINFAALRRANFVLGPLYFVTFIFFAVFVLLNMFLAIVNDAYAGVKENLVKQRTSLRLKDMVKKSAKEMFKMMRHKSTKSLVQILRSADLFGREIIPFDEYRTALKRYGYGDTEIVSSFIKYDLDGDNCLNRKEQLEMENEIEVGVKMDTSNAEEDEGHGTDDEVTGEARDREGGVIEFVDPKDYSELVERVEALETSVLSVLSQGDQLLAMLEQVEVAKREHRRQLMNTLKTLETRRYPSQEDKLDLG